MKNVKETFNTISIGTIIIDVLIVVLGIFFMVNPSVGLESALLLIGVLLLISGICAIIKYIMNPKRFFRYELGYGIISIIAGLFAILKPFKVATLIVALIAIWLIISSVIKLMLALELRKLKDVTWIFDLTVFVLTIILGILILVNPFSSTMILSVYVGVLLTMYASMDIVEQFFIRKRIKTIINIFSK